MQTRWFTIRSFFLASILLLSVAGSSQSVIDEDFLDNIEANVSSLWAENIPQFAVSAVPDKYKNESAIVFGYRRSVTIDKKSRSGFLSKGERSLVFLENIRFKIKLNDRNSVKSFTEIYFRYRDKTDGFSAKVIKSDGTSRPVSLNDAVSVESGTDIPEFFKSFFDQQNSQQNRYYKVAIPDLEPGDILEYVTVTKSKLDVLGTGYIEFTPQYEICNKVYPILFNQIIIETDNKSFFKSSSINSAPNFKKEASSDPEFFRYVFTDSDRGVEKDINFVNPYEVYPMTKFQVIYSNNDKVKGALIGNVGEIKSSFTKEELAEKAWDDYTEVGDSYYPGYGTVQKLIDALWGEYMRKGVKNWTDKDYIQNVYYRLRNLVVNRDSYLPDKVAAYLFGSLLYQKDIKSQLVITVSHLTGNISKTLFEQEIRYVVKVNKDYYFNSTDHSNPGELVEDLLGNEAYIIDKADKRSPVTIKKINLPETNFADNLEAYTINTGLASNMATLNVERNSRYTGLSKSRKIASALKFTPYMFDDYENYGGEAPPINTYESITALKEDLKEAREKQEKEDLQSEFRQKVKYKASSIISQGRSFKKKDLQIKETFELPGMVRKAGKNYLVNLPGLVGSQLQIKKEERERKYDMNVGFGRSLSWVINFTIPEGYKAEGLQELNNKVENDAGSFSCVTEEKDGTVVITINKTYKNAITPKEKWSDMLAFIDAAYNNSYKYILLKPNK